MTKLGNAPATKGKAAARVVVAALVVVVGYLVVIGEAPIVAQVADYLAAYSDGSPQAANDMYLGALVVFGVLGLFLFWCFKGGKK